MVATAFEQDTRTQPGDAGDADHRPAAQAVAGRVAARRGCQRAGLHRDDPVPGRQGAHCGGDVGASEAIVAQPDQALILGPPRSQVEPAPREAGGLERAGAVFDAFRAAVADLCRQPGAVEDSDEGRHRDPTSPLF